MLIKFKVEGEIKLRQNNIDRLSYALDTLLDLSQGKEPFELLSVKSSETKLGFVGRFEREEVEGGLEYWQDYLSKHYNSFEGCSVEVFC